MQTEPFPPALRGPEPGSVTARRSFSWVALACAKPAKVRSAPSAARNTAVITPANAQKSGPAIFRNTGVRSGWKRSRAAQAILPIEKLRSAV